MLRSYLLSAKIFFSCTVIVHIGHLIKMTAIEMEYEAVMQTTKSVIFRPMPNALQSCGGLMVYPSSYLAWRLETTDICFCFLNYQRCY